MNQKDRILELVDKGIISAEEAVVLLEKWVRRQATKNNQLQAKLILYWKGSECIYKILSSKRPNRRIDSSGLKTLQRNRSPYRWNQNGWATEPLTVDEEMELVRLQEEAEQLNNQYKSLLQEKKTSRCQNESWKETRMGRKL